MMIKFNLLTSSPTFCSLTYEKLGEFEGLLDINVEGNLELFYPDGHLDMATEIGSSLPIHVYLDMGGGGGEGEGGRERDLLKCLRNNKQVSTDK